MKLHETVIFTKQYLFAKLELCPSLTNIMFYNNTVNLLYLV